MRVLIALLLSLFGTVVVADTMRLAVTTSFHNSGLSDVLLPAVKKDTGLDVQLLVVGTGQALRLGQAGDVDAILVHSKAAEEAFVTQGYGTHRREIMYNDFVLIGPTSDPAGVRDATTAREALQMVAEAQVSFVSRGDDSGTHRKERAIWKDAALDPERFANWYKAVGAGMGASLNTASGLDAYIFSDRASWLKFANKGGLMMLFAGDPEMFNQYSYLPVDPERHPHVRTDAAQQFEHWLTSPAGQYLIDGYQIDGEKLFTFNAVP